MSRLKIDAVILDLEDAVPFSAKSAARRHVRAALESTPAAREVWVRVNPSTLDADLDAVFTPALTGIFLPKAEPQLLAQADEALRTVEQARHRPPGSTPVIALIESACGLLAAPEVAAAPRVSRLGVGEADLIGELGLRPSRDRAELTSIRLQIVIAAAAAGLAPPIGPVETRIGSDTDLGDSTRALLTLGFRARTAIHPTQLATINEIFTPTADEIAAARSQVELLGDHGVAVDEQGRLVDAAVLRSAYEILSFAATNDG